MSRNGKILLNEFISEITGDENLFPELGELYSIIEDVAMGERLPNTRFKKLSLSAKLKIQPWEAKSKHLRLYCIQHSGLILIIGGKKTAQKKDLKRLEAIIKEYSNNQ